MTTTTSRKAALGASGIGVLAGVTGLVLLSAPAGAGQAPSLPTTTPEALVTSVLQAKPAAFGGTVTATQDLGLPALPGVPQSSDGDTTVRLWSDGTGKGRVALPDRGSEQTVVEDGKAVWTYDSAKHEAEKVTIPAKALREHPRTMFGQEAAANPIAMVKPMLDQLRKTSTVAVDGTASVAGRDAYELVLTPKPAERTLLRQVRVAVDNELRMPLRFDVYGYGSTDPVLHIGFSELNVGAQDPALFRFTPPAGTKVHTIDAGEQARKAQEHQARGAKPELDTKVLGDGWDSVLLTDLNTSLGKDRSKDAGNGGEGRDGTDPRKLLRQVGKPVSGPWGDGYLVHTAVANAIIASDGRVAAGFVPQQVLATALENDK